MTQNADPPLETDCRTVSQKLSAGGNFVLVDCREQEEFDTVRIPEARLLPMSQLADRVDELAPYRDFELAIHCHHGGRSLRVAKWLREQGFSKAQSMAGGIDQWAVEIDPSLPRY
jgi:rhodanese-related sulfurtransferase